VNKPLAIVGNNGAAIYRPGAAGEMLVVENLPAGSDFVMRGIFFLGALERAALSNCQGRILLDDISVGPKLSIDGCAQVMLNQCDLTLAATITTLNVTMSECLVTATLLFPDPGLAIARSTVHLSHTNVMGGSLVALNPAPGIAMDGAAVTIAGDATTMISAAVLGPPGVSAITGTGFLTVDPDVTLAPTGTAPAIASGVSIELAELPALVATGAGLGGQLNVEVRGEVADLFALFVGIPASPVPIPAYHGELWLAPATAICLSSGILDASARRSLSFPVPSDPGFLGVHLGWIAIAGPTLQSLRLTNNVSHTVSEL
jgi:hypothetical protein